MPNYVEYATGTVTTAYDLINDFSVFVTGQCGWTLEGTDDPGDGSYLDKVFSSTGTEVGRYDTAYVRLYGSGSRVDVYGYKSWSSFTTSSGELHDSTYSNIVFTWPAGGTITWHGFGDEDGFWMVVDDTSSWYSLYGGYIYTYYPNTVDVYPLAVVGQTTASQWYNAQRVHMYGVNDVRSGYSGASAVLYGTGNIAYTEMISYSNPSTRDSSEIGHAPMILYTTSLAEGVEVRGELLHVMQFAGGALSSGDWYTVSGTSYKYLIKSYSDAQTEGFGPLQV